MKDDRYFLKVITYNIHSGKNLSNLPQLNDIIEFFKNEHAHVIGVQEINENNQRGNQVSQIENALKMNSAFAPNVKIGNGYYGVSTFTSFKILKVHYLPLPSQKEQRGLIHTVLKIGNKKLNVLNTHLGLSVDERNKQFKIIEKYLNSLHSPSILMGDFNTTTPKFNSLTMMDTAIQMEKSFLPTFIPSEKRIDYTFTSKPIKILHYSVIPVKMSDHYPVMVDILL
ncbi:endonuclease/exonuclease/phosphatase family protein [Crassaminicella profunda]|uniref:endonuclease/exonuclease/phosphatase family protein n=1 Tax=Crassaminicella profunda TaxID=1286698 RepID=UPI001CA698D0|nr:endonuclease/exonuclease/phosphatase family protein [Crassaminicella profunda]QZY56436.1 endonuclease/exonuclease/phosphatase family protein [Crassaminicella profunda]